MTSRSATPGCAPTGADLPHTGHSWGASSSVGGATPEFRPQRECPALAPSESRPHTRGALAPARAIAMMLVVLHSPQACAVADPNAQIASGRMVYSERCASCHDADGATGSKLTPELLASYYTARALFDYVQMSMPFDQPGSLSEEQYWRSVAYLLASRGLFDGSVQLSAETADSVILQTAGPQPP